MLCNSKNLGNESSVEQFFVIRLLKRLGWPDSNIRTKESIEELIVGRGARAEKYKPDYVLFKSEKPKIVIDAKSTNENVDKFVYQISGYALNLNRYFENESPVIYTMLTNGLVTKLFRWDKKDPMLTIKFDEFSEENQKYKKLVSLLAYSAIKREVKQEEEKEFYLQKLNAADLNGIFRACHNLIWKKEKKKPTEAFYEFAKLFFIKVKLDKELSELSKTRTITPEDVKFSVNWINREEKNTDNPVADILFKNLREELELKVKKREKKRVFDRDEELDLKPSTIKETTKILEHVDLSSVSEDLNGRMFEAFLTATIRGKELGQFFTPRSVVKFMVDLAELKCDKEYIDSVLDACCGTGGFLIDAMAGMWGKIDKNKSLSDREKANLKNKVVTEYLWGADADKDKRLPISKIARMNMVLHGDGSNRIYWVPDSLDKELEIEKGIKDTELKAEADEFREEIIEKHKKFDVVLTNPPFSMRYEIKQPDEKRILEQYIISRQTDTNKLKASTKSNVLFIERYHDLLNPGGKLLTVIDESVLNADSEKDYRDYIRSHFVIKAIISLPKNTFVNADTGVKTSILYLIKRDSENGGQPPIFMAISENVGHTDSGKPSPDKNDLNSILEKFKLFESGKL